MSEYIRADKNRVVRHSVVELAEHWTIALSGLLLLLSGLFELPMAARYKITAIPGLAWSGDFITSLSVHYAASVVFIAASLFHIVHHGLSGDWGLIPRRGDLKTSIAVIKTFFGKGEEPPFEKYLPEQRLAYLGMAAVIAVLILSGLVKTAKNLYAPDMNYTLVLWATWLHNLFFILFVLAFVAHIGAILLKPNRPMVRGIVTGSVRLDYARHRHPLWLAGMEPQRAPLLPEGPRIDEALAPASDVKQPPLSDTVEKGLGAAVKQEPPKDPATESPLET
ncbi:MAG: cytochrome b/b6 domain-containing protein [Deltaproteobacteria bacterium]|nr:cytochrome b/b6 domain-containing protein [Deltaproteobacteria bacterium]